MRPSHLLPSSLVLALAAGASAQDRYQEMLDEALRLEREVRAGEQGDAPLERAYLRLADAAKLAPQRWEAFALRGTNRCTTAVVCRSRLAELLREARARGEPAEVLEGMEGRGQHYIDVLIENARQNFQVMHRLMKDAREVDPNRLRFAVAAVRYAEASYLGDGKGAPGAIDAFKELVGLGWNVDFCSEFIARCYIQLGIAAVVEKEYAQGQSHWDEAAKWGRTALTKRIILSNKAAAYDLEDEYAHAEDILRKLIEMEPDHPLHWKNLGLMLGHQNRLRAALRAYERTRELCESAGGPIPLGFFHGNAWLKAAMIHGKLLEHDGDLLLAWRLFLEYRNMLGDDYPFCVNFGEFVYHMGQYDLAWEFLRRARDLQPYCVVAHQLLLMTVQRMQGSPEEMAQRTEEARAAQREAQSRYQASEETPEFKRLCGGLRDRMGTTQADAPAPLLDPDPLAGYTPERPPPWIIQATEARQPFRPGAPDPGDEERNRVDAGPRAPAAPGPPLDLRFWGLTLGGLAAATTLFILLRRPRRA